MAERGSKSVFQWICPSGKSFLWLHDALLKLCGRESELVGGLQAVIPVGEMETHKLQQWARTFQAYSHVRWLSLCSHASGVVTSLE